MTRAEVFAFMHFRGGFCRSEKSLVRQFGIGVFRVLADLRELKMIERLYYGNGIVMYDVIPKWRIQ